MLFLHFLIMLRCYFMGISFICPMRASTYNLIDKTNYRQKGDFLFELDIMNYYNRFIFPRESRKIDGHFTFRRQTLFNVLPQVRNLYISPGKCISSVDAFWCPAASAKFVYFPLKMHFVGRRFWMSCREGGNQYISPEKYILSVDAFRCPRPTWKQQNIIWRIIIITNHADFTTAF